MYIFWYISWINSSQFFSFSQVLSCLELNHQKPSVFHTMEQCQCGQKFVSVQLVSHCSWCQQRLEEGLVARFILWLDLLMDNVTHRAVQHNWKHWSCAPETWSWMCFTAAGVSKDWRRAWRQIHLVARASNFLVFAQQSSQQMSSVIFVHFFLGWKLSIVSWANLAF